MHALEYELQLDEAIAHGDAHTQKFLSSIFANEQASLDKLIQEVNDGLTERRKTVIAFIKTTRIPSEAECKHHVLQQFIDLLVKLDLL